MGGGVAVGDGRAQHTAVSSGSARRLARRPLLEASPGDPPRDILSCATRAFRSTRLRRSTIHHRHRPRRLPVWWEAQQSGAQWPRDPRRARRRLAYVMTDGAALPSSSDSSTGHAAASSPSPSRRAMPSRRPGGGSVASALRWPSLPMPTPSSGMVPGVLGTSSPLGTSAPRWRGSSMSPPPSVPADRVRRMSTVTASTPPHQPPRRRPSTHAVSVPSRPTLAHSLRPPRRSCRRGPDVGQLLDARVRITPGARSRGDRFSSERPPPRRAGCPTLVGRHVRGRSLSGSSTGPRSPRCPRPLPASSSSEAEYV